MKENIQTCRERDIFRFPELHISISRCGVVYEKTKSVKTSLQSLLVIYTRWSWGVRKLLLIKLNIKVTFSSILLGVWYRLAYVYN